MYQRVLVAIDGSAASTKALDEAVQLAQLTGGKLCLVHVCDDCRFATGYETGQAFLDEVVPYARKTGDAILAEGRDHVAPSAVPVETVLVECIGAKVAPLVIEQAQSWSADLIVVGTHGRHGLDRALMGSDAEGILRTSPLPVLLVRSSDWTS